MRLLFLLPAVLVATVLVAPSVAGVTVDLRSGNTVRGTLDPVDQVEVFTIAVPAGAVLKIKANGVRKGPAVGVRVQDDLDALVGEGEFKERKTGISGKVPLVRGGAYTIEVFSRDGASAGDYSLKVSWKSPKLYTEAAPAGDDAGSVTFHADRGAFVNAGVAAAKGSAVVPRITSITGPSDFELLFGGPTKTAADNVKKVPVPFTGRYTLHYANDGTAGAVKARVTVKQPRVSKATFDVTNRAIGTVGEGGGSAMGGVVMADEQTIMTIGESTDESDPLRAIVGASIRVPPHALRKATGVVIGTAAALELPPGEADGLFGAGAATLFGPERQQFGAPVELALPAEVVEGQDGVVLYRRSASVIERVTDGVEVGDGHVTVAVRQLGVYQVFSAEQAARPEFKLTAADGAEFDNFGSAVAIDGDTAVVGSRFDDDSGIESGSVYVYKRDPTGGWALQAKLTASNARADDRFGTTVDIDGDTIIVGSWSSTPVGLQAGSAYVFTRDGAGVWTERAELTASDAERYDLFGYAVAIHRDTVVVGSFFDSDDGASSGSAYVFTRDGVGVWTEQAKLTASDAAAGDRFGSRVAVDGDTVVCGAPLGNGDSETDSGSAYVFTRDGSGVWTERAELTASDAAGGELFGADIAVDGDTVVVVAPGDDEDGIDSGAAYVFTRDGAGVWSEHAKLRASDAVAGQMFGGRIDISGGTVVVGAGRDDTLATDSGAAYVFRRDGAGVWSELKKLTASDAAESDLFGIAVGCDGNTVIVGAQWDDDAGLESGSAYIYDVGP